MDDAISEKEPEKKSFQAHFTCVVGIFVSPHTGLDVWSLPGVEMVACKLDRAFPASLIWRVSLSSASVLFETHFPYLFVNQYHNNISN